MTKLYIATPVHGWRLTGLYYATMEALRLACRDHGWSLLIQPWFGVSDIIRRRNVDVHRFLCTDATDLITFDEDQGADPETFIKLVEGPDVTAAPVPKKADNLPLKDAWNFICEPGEPEVRGEYMRVALVGAGCMRISRRAILDMCYENPVFMVEGQPVPELYAKDFVDKDGLWPAQLSEDYTFCKRATTAGYPPWIWVPGKVKHLGEKIFQGGLHV